MSRSRTLVAVHGGGTLPEHKNYRELWRTALRAGLVRDAKAQLGAFDDLELVMPWAAEPFKTLRAPTDSVLDLADRQAALDVMAGHSTTKAFRRLHYERLPGKSALSEFVATVAAPALGIIGLGQMAVEAAVPELALYWADDPSVREHWRGQLHQTLATHLKRDDSVLVVAHGVGAVVAWDVLWQLGQEMPEHKLELLITLGSPLANNTVRNRLRGWSEPPERRFPANLKRWHNIAAEDDFLCHDKTVADDFGAMLQRQQISELVDHHVYNLSVRYGRSAPGHSAGYLAHPRTAELLSNWLAD